MGLNPDHLTPKRPEERSEFELCQSTALQTLFSVYFSDYVSAFPTPPHTIPMHQKTPHHLLAPDLIVTKTPLSLIEAMQTLHDRIDRLQKLLKQSNNPTERFIIQYILRESSPVFRPVQMSAMAVSYSLVDTWHHLVDLTRQHYSDIPPVLNDKRVILKLHEPEIDSYLTILQKIGVSIGNNPNDPLSWKNEEASRQEYALYLVSKRPHIPISDSTKTLIAHPHWYKCFNTLEENLSYFRLKPLDIYTCFEGGLNSGVFFPTYIKLYLKDDYKPKDVHLASTMNLDAVSRFLEGLVRPYKSYKTTDAGERLHLDYPRGKFTCPAGYGPSPEYRSMLTDAGYQTGASPLIEAANPNGAIQQNISAELDRFVTWYQEYGQSMHLLPLAPSEAHLLGLSRV